MPVVASATRVNLVGQILTVLNLRQKFGLDSCDIQTTMRVVVVKSGEERVGLLVDQVHDVILVSAADVEPPPANVVGISGDFLSGVVKMDNQLVAIVNVDELIKNNQQVA